MGATLKPWPADAIMVVAPFPATANRAGMDSVHPGECRDCGRAVVYDGFTMRRSLEIAGGERPVKFFCVECFQHYDFGQVTHHEDHRGHRLEKTK